MQCPARDQRHHDKHENFEWMPARVAVEITDETFDLINDAVDVAISWTSAIT